MKEKNVIEFYVMCNKLKDIVRTGWKVWEIKRERLESIAEHIFGVQMLAIAMWSEYKYDIDIMKVITMIAVHETEELIIGDFTPFQMSKEEKNKIGNIAVKKIFSVLTNAQSIENLIYEFNDRKTKEAKFAHFCDKLECDIQCKLYDEECKVNMNNQKALKSINNQYVNKLVENSSSLSEMWIKYGQNKASYDDNFLSVSKYVLNNKLLD